MPSRGYTQPVLGLNIAEEFSPSEDFSAAQLIGGQAKEEILLAAC